MRFNVGIVLYNSSVENLSKICKEFNKSNVNIILVDNKSANINDIKKAINKYQNITLIENASNKGIAKALDQLIDKTREEDVQYLLTLDQDSFIKFDEVNKMLDYFKLDNVAIICPEIKDLNKDVNKFMKKPYKQVPRCITSGSIMNLQLCKKVGSFDEKMFIDYVDFDYCKRISLNGYKILKIKNCILIHEVGKRTIRHFLWKKVYPTNHTSNRVYYQVRNMHYYCLKYKNDMTIKEKIYEFIRIVWKYVSIILYEDAKKDKIIHANKGYKDAYLMIKKDKEG